MKQMLFTLLVIGLAYPLSWSEFVKLEPNQKYAIMGNNLEKMINGTIAPILPKDELKAILSYFKPEEAKMVKVGNQYISEKVCKETPALCEIKNETKKPPAQKPIVKTIEQCLDAREKDWQNWCWINPKIDCANAPASAKKEILDNLAKSENSHQGRCLRGE